MAKSNDTHFIMYYSTQSGGFVITTPRLWAHANPHHFGGAIPRTKDIEKYLKDNFGFEPAKNEHAVLLYNYSDKIPKSKQGISFV